MAKAFGIHTLTLKPGVKAEDFEKLVIEDVNSLPRFEGFEFYICKGDKGERDGKYIFMYDFESVESRERFVTGRGVLSEEGQQYVETIQRVYEEVMKKWDTFVTTRFGFGNPATDYVVVGK
jgi:hypothetical protein